MKRAKLLLSALAVLTVVGGALAFKAKTNPNVYTSDADGICKVKIPFRTVPQGFPGSFTITGSITTTALTTTCPLTTFTVVNDN